MYLYNAQVLRIRTHKLCGLERISFMNKQMVIMEAYLDKVSHIQVYLRVGQRLAGRGNR